VLSSKAAYFRTQSLSLGNLQDVLVKLSQDSNTMRSMIFMINIYIYNNHFKIFRNREYEGVQDLMCENVGETK